MTWFTKSFVIVPLAIMIAALLVASPTRASEARAEALGSPLVEDDTDIVDFPGMLAAYSNMVFLNLRPPMPTEDGEVDAEEMDGSLGVAFGRDVSLGIWLHRKSRWRDLEDTAELFEFSTPMPTTYDLLDVFFGIAGGFGARISFAAGLQSDEQFNEDGKVVSTGATTFASDIQLGYSFDVDGYHGDLGAGLTFSWFEILESGYTKYQSRAAPSFLFRHRSVFGPRRDLSGVIDLMLTRRAYTVETRDEDKSEVEQGDFGRWYAELTAGPRVRLPGNVTLWVGTRFFLEDLSGTIGQQDQPTLRSYGAPGVVGSLEVLLWDLLTVRAGASYDVYWLISIVDAPYGTDSDEIGGIYAGKQEMGQRFRWSTGLGLTLGGFQVDATVARNLYFEGPQFIGGGAPGFLGMLSAAYMW
ncbi:MAG: hypothetical protein JRF63_00050 [Deltaproteobacteria bacterium]|nr:hypothetical protein [Deltaproteobacteria bacterium]